MAPSRLPLLFVLVVVMVAGCPRRFDPRADEIHSNNPEAEAEYRAAQRKFVDGDYEAANQAVRLFGEKYGSGDALSGWVRLLDARIARAQQQLERARDTVQPLIDAPDSKLSMAARFELGLIAHRLGDPAKAQQLLAPFSSQIVDGDEASELHAVLADSYRHSDRLTDALHEYELFYRRARPLEQAYIQNQVRALLPRLAVTEQTDARSRFGLSPMESSAKPSSPGGLRIGVVLPLSGKDRALGERVLRGALWSARGAHLGPGTPAASLPVELLLRDTASLPAAAGAAVSELAREGAQALIASPVKAEASAVAKAASALRLPTLHLAAPTANGPSLGERAFHLLYSNEERAARLAEKLRAEGLTSVAVLAPATPYGQSMTRAFVEALATSPVRVVAQLTFPASSTTFTAAAKQILELGPQALFIPATATQLELVAGQLAALGGLATQRVEKRESEPPIRLLLSTVEGLTPRLLAAAGRYLQGAVLAPVAAVGIPLVAADTRFERYGQDGGGQPGALDAMGFDAVEALRAACVGPTAGSGACPAELLLANLPLLSAPGTTGDIAFQPTGQRRGQPLLLRIEGPALRVLR